MPLQKVVVIQRVMLRKRLADCLNKFWFEAGGKGVMPVCAKASA